MNTPLVTHLLDLAQKQDRAALAALRTGLGKPPGAAARMWPHVAPFVRGEQPDELLAAFTTASLFATHPHHAEIGSLGKSLRQSVKTGSGSGKHGEDGVEERFVAALDSHPDDLPRHLQILVSLCESAAVPVDWNRFYLDSKGLFGQNEDYQLSIRNRWARDFWRGSEQDQLDDKEE